MKIEENPITIYEPCGRKKIGFFKIWVTVLKNIVSSKDLIIQLFYRDFFAVYKKSFLDFGWVIISPLIGIISWIFMSATGILNPGEVGVPYPAYVLIGSSIWGFFMGSYSFAAKTLISGTGYILQVRFAHEALLVKQCAQNMANFFLSFTLNIIVLMIFGVMPDWKIIFFPIMLLPLLFLGAGIGLVISVINVLTNEIEKMVEMLLGLVIYITPVIYSQNFGNPLVQKIIKWNPLSYLISGARDIILYGKIEHLDKFMYSCLFSFLVFMFSLRFFYVSEDKVIEKMT